MTDAIAASKSSRVAERRTALSPSGGTAHITSASLIGQKNELQTRKPSARGYIGVVVKRSVIRQGCTQADCHVFKISEVKRMAAILNFEKTPENPGGGVRSTSLH